MHLTLLANPAPLTNLPAGWTLIGRVTENGHDVPLLVGVNLVMAALDDGVVTPLRDQAEGRRQVIIAIGPLLYGPEWKTPFARDLGVSVRILHFWVDGRHGPRLATLRQALLLCADHVRVLAPLGAALRQVSPSKG